MSTDINFAMNTVWVEGPNGEPHFLVSEQWGSSNTRDDRGNIPRSWSARCFGSMTHVLSLACRFAQCWGGGSSQRGFGVNGRTPMGVQGYLRQLEKSMRSATRVSSITLAPLNARYPPEGQYAAELGDAFTASLAALGLAPDSKTLVMDTPASVAAGAAVVAVAERHTNWLEQLFHAYPYGGLGEVAVLPRLKKIDLLLPQVCSIPNSYGKVVVALPPTGDLIGWKAAYRITDNYRVCEMIETSVQTLAALGGDAARIYEQLDRAVKAAAPFEHDVEFEIVKGDLRWTPILESGLGVGVHRIKAAELGKFAYAKALENGAFTVIPSSVNPGQTALQSTPAGAERHA
jgi:hypothetical protein